MTLHLKLMQDNDYYRKTEIHSSLSSQVLNIFYTRGKWVKEKGAFKHSYEHFIQMPFVPTSAYSLMVFVFKSWKRSSISSQSDAMLLSTAQYSTNTYTSALIYQQVKHELLPVWCRWLYWFKLKSTCFVKHVWDRKVKCSWDVCSISSMSQLMAFQSWGMVGGGGLYFYCCRGKNSTAPKHIYMYCTVVQFYLQAFIALTWSNKYIYFLNYLMTKSTMSYNACLHDARVLSYPLLTLSSSAQGI